MIPAAIPNEEIRENKRKTHRFNVVQKNAYVHGNWVEDFHYSKIKVTRKGIYTNRRSTPAFAHFFLCLSLNMSHIVQQGSQRETFSEAFFDGSKGLCRHPLSVSCQDVTPSRFDGSHSQPTFDGSRSPPTSNSRHSGSKMEIKWEYIAPEIGFMTRLGIVYWSLVLCKR